jgi:hypothetical protein
MLDLLLDHLFGLFPHGQFVGNRLPEFPVTGIAGMVAQTDDGRGRGESMPGQFMDAHIHNQSGIFQNMGHDFLFRGTEKPGFFPQL